jgi:hypothetical protein
MANKWFKFYGGEYLADPKIASLTPQEKSCWITLLCLGSISSQGGIIEYLTVEVLLKKSGIDFDPYHPEEWEKCLGILKKLEKMKMIKANESGVIEIVHWDVRQETALTGYERIKKYREKKKGETIPITKEDKKKELQAYTIPDWLDAEVWDSWVKYRKDKKKPLTPRAMELCIKLLATDKTHAKEMIEKSIMGGWTGLFALAEESRKLEKKGGIKI